MAGFVQIIEFQTSRRDEVEALGREIRDRLDDGRSSSPKRGTIVADRDRPNYYLNIVEFDSQEAAMENSRRPEGRSRWSGPSAWVTTCPTSNPA
jgi:hypothetical protein